MKHLRQLAITLSLLAPMASATTEQAAELMRNGLPHEALKHLNNPSTPEAHFWRGRCLIDLKQPEEAIKHLQQVPQEHKLFPYAFKGILYCAWKFPAISFDTVVAPYASPTPESYIYKKHPQLVKLAAAALAENWLQKPDGQDNAALQYLTKHFQEDADLSSIFTLLEIDNLLLKKDFTQAIKKAQQFESNRNLPLITRHRTRLIIAKIYFQWEAQLTPEQIAQLNAQQQEQPEDEETGPIQPDNPIGKGEETLIHFITSNPESLLLEEAFSKLLQHKTFINNSYARIKLNEWISDTAKPRRAALALLVQQDLVLQDAKTQSTPDSTYANTAIAHFKNEDATNNIVLTYVRELIEAKQLDKAATYLSHIESFNDYLHAFYSACLALDKPQEAAQQFLKCAAIAPREVWPTAYANAMYCALLCNDEALQREIQVITNSDPVLDIAVTLVQAHYYMEHDLEKAQTFVLKLKSMDLPKNIMPDVIMDYALLQMQESPILGAMELVTLKSGLLSASQQIRLQALREASIRQGAAPDRQEESNARITALAKTAIANSKDSQVKCVLSLHLANILSRRNLHTEAILHLDYICQTFPDTPYAKQALFLSAHELENIGTISSLKQAAERYHECAKIDASRRIRAIVHRASILIRIDQGKEAEKILTQLLESAEKPKTHQLASIYAVLATKYAMDGTDESLQKALACCAALGKNPETNKNDKDNCKRILENTEIPLPLRYLLVLRHSSIQTHLGNDKEALRNCLTVLETQPAAGPLPDDFEWVTLYRAGTAAISICEKLKDFRQAAEIADRIAHWNVQHANPVKARQFEAWANHLRQTKGQMTIPTFSTSDR